MPGGVHASTKKASTAPYAQTGVASRDSYRKLFFDNISTRLQEEAANQPVPLWTETLEDALFTLCHSEVKKDYRDKANQVIRNMKVAAFQHETRVEQREGRARPESAEY